MTAEQQSVHILRSSEFNPSTNIRLLRRVRACDVSTSRSRLFEEKYAAAAGVLHLAKAEDCMDYPTDATFTDIGAMLSVDYASAKQLLDHTTISLLVGRVVWDIVHNRMTQTEAIVKHRKEWRRALGLPPLTPLRDASS